MGKSFHVVRPLEPPLAEVEDRVMFVPRGKELVVERPEPRLLLICDGRVRLAVDDVEIGDIGPGDVVVVPGPSRLVYRAAQNRAVSRLHVFRIQFDGSQFTYDPKTSWLMRLGSRHEETDFTVFIQNHFCELRHLVRGQTAAMYTLLEAIRQDAETESRGFRHRVSARTRLLVTLIGERLAALGAPVPMRVEQPRPRWITEQIKEYLLTHAAEALTLEDVARHLRLSAEHIARVFKREESTTVFDFLRDIRIERAKALLASSSLSVHDISRQAGYSSSTLFCRNFKRVTGGTPAAYRQKGGGRRSISGSTIRAANSGAGEPPGARREIN
ncbi:MAG: helix-turn-helix transcriptional regulator [Opitutaceae bacterium]|nr:helix-turn-helix transcriptional regulator [Opitutaceae bacterium]